MTTEQCYQSLEEGCGKLRVWECGLAVVNKHLIGLLVVLMTGTVIHSGPQRAVSNCLAARVDLVPVSRALPSRFPWTSGFPPNPLETENKNKRVSATRTASKGSINKGVHIFLYFSIKKALLCLDLTKNKTEKKRLKKFLTRS